MKLMDMMDPGGEMTMMMTRKLAPPLVTLLSAEPEIQYVALRNINIIVQKKFVFSFVTFVENEQCNIIDEFTLLLDP